MTPGRAALICLMRRYLGGFLDPFVTLLEIHKLMYFMQEAGEPLKLNFTKARYGPYAENLRHVLRPIEGHFISGYADGGDAPHKPLELVPGALDDASAYLEDSHETRERMDRVTNLIEGFESSFGLELLTTVHWVASRGPAAAPAPAPAPADDVIRLVYEWGSRKRRFSERQIRLALHRLEQGGWLG